MGIRTSTTTGRGPKSHLPNYSVVIQQITLSSPRQRASMSLLSHSKSPVVHPTPDCRVIYRMLTTVRTRDSSVTDTSVI
jgi:hypothetical protein